MRIFDAQESSFCMNNCTFVSAHDRGGLWSRFVFALMMAAALLAVPTIAFAQVTVNQVNVQANIGRGQDATVGLQYTRTSSAAGNASAW